MKNKLPKRWQKNLEMLDIAFQPILNIHTGKLYAVEALLRNFQEIGFQSIFSLFDKVYQENLLYTFDIYLREKAIKKFTTIERHENIKLFYNLDNRIFEMQNFKEGNTEKILKKYGVKKDNICFEISERQEIAKECDIGTVVSHYQDENFSIALDDFGIGHSGYKLLYDSTPDVLKIDRFFLNNIEKNLKKKLMVRNITHLAIQLGVRVVAEGVETREELLVCKDIGCHLLQGYLVQKPTKNTKEILPIYPHIVDLVRDDRRVSDTNYQIKMHLDKTEALNIKSKASCVIDFFRTNQETSILPIVNLHNEPIGIINESQIKGYLYSQYGRALLLNDSKKTKIKNLIKRCGSADINSDILTIIEIFSNDSESVGIIITNNSQYYGFLSARAIITIINEQNILQAREQNPLTKLPGNIMIEKYIEQSILTQDSYLLCYFDLDNFKAFNDVYGFRNGDRVIQLFADLLKKHLEKEFFKAHIGGDDFFVGVKCTEENENFYLECIKKIISKFTIDVKGFYSAEDKKNGYIVSKDRDNNIKKFPLLSVSGSVLFTHKNSKGRTLDSINHILAKQKKTAKQEPCHLCVSCLLS